MNHVIAAWLTAPDGQGSEPDVHDDTAKWRPPNAAWHNRKSWYSWFMAGQCIQGFWQQARSRLRCKTKPLCERPKAGWGSQWAYWNFDSLSFACILCNLVGSQACTSEANSRKNPLEGSGSIIYCLYLPIVPTSQTMMNFEGCPVHPRCLSYRLIAIICWFIPLRMCASSHSFLHSSNLSSSGPAKNDPFEAASTGTGLLCLSELALLL